MPTNPIHLDFFVYDEEHPPNYETLANRFFVVSISDRYARSVLCECRHANEYSLSPPSLTERILRNVDDLNVNNIILLIETSHTPLTFLLAGLDHLPITLYDIIDPTDHSITIEIANLYLRAKELLGHDENVRSEFTPLARELTARNIHTHVFEHHSFFSSHISHFPANTVFYFDSFSLDLATAIEGCADRFTYVGSNLFDMFTGNRLVQIAKAFSARNVNFWYLAAQVWVEKYSLFHTHLARINKPLTWQRKLLEPLGAICAALLSCAYPGIDFSRQRIILVAGSNDTIVSLLRYTIFNAGEEYISYDLPVRLNTIAATYFVVFYGYNNIPPAKQRELVDFIETNLESSVVVIHAAKLRTFDYMSSEFCIIEHPDEETSSDQLSTLQYVFRLSRLPRNYGKLGDVLNMFYGLAMCCNNAYYPSAAFPRAYSLDDLWDDFLASDFSENPNDDARGMPPIRLFDLNGDQLSDHHDEEVCIFRQETRTWYIVFEGVATRCINSHQGFRMIQHLLRNPNADIAPETLYKLRPSPTGQLDMPDEPDMEPDVQHDPFDEGWKQAFTSRLRDGKLATLDFTNRPSAELDRIIAALQQRLKGELDAATRKDTQTALNNARKIRSREYTKFGRERRMDNLWNEKVKANIYKNIKQALLALDDAHEGLGKHLRTTFHYSRSSYRYAPTPNITWET